MTDKEVEALIDDHYQGEAQTLTTAAEQNLLKLAELRGRLAPEKAERWTQIKDEFLRQRRMGSATDDPVTRLSGSLGGELGTIRDALVAMQKGGGQALGKEVANLRQAVSVLSAEAKESSQDLGNVLGERLEKLVILLGAQAQRPIPAGGHSDPAMIKDVLEQQLRLVERTLLPLAQAGLETRNDRQDREALVEQMAQIRALMQQMDARLSDR
jgi:hypothetical protein